MQIYFGKATDEVIDATNYSGLFIGQDSESFYTYGIDFGTVDTDEIIIYDGFDRRVPIDVDSIDELISALEKVKDLIDEVKSVERFKANISNSNFSYSV
jgi:hypothetical protein